MSEPGEDNGHDEYMAEIGQEKYEQDLIKNAFKEVSEDNARYFLIENICEYLKKIEKCQDESKQLLDCNFYGPSLVLSVTGIEITIKYLLIRPLVYGSFLSDEWADILLEKMFQKNRFTEKELLPIILSRWNVDISTYKLTNEKKVWNTMKNEIWTKRNKYIHEAKPINRLDAECAFECAELFLGIVIEVAKNLDIKISD